MPKARTIVNALLEDSKELKHCPECSKMKPDVQHRDGSPDGPVGTMCEACFDDLCGDI